jgi:hypothetical protein
MNGEMQTTLTDLRWHWEDAYRIDYADGLWAASPLSNVTEMITADTAMELRTKIRYDYAERRTQARQS